MQEHGTVIEDKGLKEVLSGRKIGEIFLELGYINKTQLDEALEYQKQKKGRIGWIMTTLGFINRIQLFQTLAIQFGLEFRTDTENLIKGTDINLLSAVTHKDVITHQAIPYRMENGRLTLLTAYPNKIETIAFFMKKFLAKEVEQIVITDLDLTKLIKQIVITDLDLTKIAEKLYRDSILDKSIYGLFYRNPKESAYSVFTNRQVIFLGAIIFFTLLWIYYDVVNFLIVTNIILQLFFTISIGFKLLLSLAGIKSEIERPVTDEELRSLKDDDLPVYTILVPVFKEPEVIGILIDSLKKLDYPQNKLDILLLLEEEDSITFEAAKKCKPPGNWRLLKVPDSLPKTKPKACNYGLFFGRGKYLVIFDAEDIPDPDQLKKSVIAFKKGGESYVCFQAALNYFNRNENFLTRMFTLEYSYWFDYLLPGLDRLKFPLPLGGTSNHFDMEKLKQLGGWDPFNTTEDADLGVRAYANGYRVGVINSTTFEEANSQAKNWIRQRSRWVKGYMQTWLVFSRHPIKLLRGIGLKGWLSFNFFVGGTPLTLLINPLTWAVFVIWVLTKTKIIEPFFPPVLLYISIFNLLFGNFLGIYLNMIAVFKRKYYYLIPYSYLNPVYWLFHSVASYKALWQLFTNPFYWEKTQHGITKFKFSGKKS